MDEEQELLHTEISTLSTIQMEMEKILSSYQVAKLIKEGVKVTLAGPPNAGKSSLLNQLVGSECAIVSSIPGTTRDVLKVDMDLDGYKVILKDTAGLRETNDCIEQEGIKRAREAVASSSICLFLIDCTSSISNAIQAIVHFQPRQNQTKQKMIVVLNKQDLIHDSSQLDLLEQSIKQQCPNVQGIKRYYYELRDRRSFHFLLSSRRYSKTNW